MQEVVMTPNNDETNQAAVAAVFGTLEKNWGWLLAFGIISVLLGGFGLYMTFGLTLATVVFFGALILTAGLLQLVQAFGCNGWKGMLAHVLIALLYVAAGILILIDPVLASSLLTLVLAGILIVVGVVRIMMALQVRKAAAGWYWALLSGLISILLGGMIIAQWPASGLWMIGLFVAIELIFSGWSYIFLALDARKSGQVEAKPA
jgi:uncharacterized membrane protein HdeD (DUF308 family)